MSNKSKTLLTPREIEVLVLVCDGLYTKEIAERLFVSVNTAGSHREHISQKVKGGIAAQVRYAIRDGWVKP